MDTNKRVPDSTYMYILLPHNLVQDIAKKQFSTCFTVWPW